MYICIHTSHYPFFESANNACGVLLATFWSIRLEPGIWRGDKVMRTTSDDLETYKPICYLLPVALPSQRGCFNFSSAILEVPRVPNESTFESSTTRRVNNWSGNHDNGPAATGRTRGARRSRFRRRMPPRANGAKPTGIGNRRRKRDPGSRIRRRKRLIRMSRYVNNDETDQLLNFARRMTPTFRCLSAGSKGEKNFTF